MKVSNSSTRRDSGIAPCSKFKGLRFPVRTVECACVSWYLYMLHAPFGRVFSKQCSSAMLF